MVLDIGSLAVELVVSGPGRQLGIGAVEAALDGRASGSSTQLLAGALGKAKDVALREHGDRGRAEAYLSLG